MLLEQAPLLFYPASIKKSDTPWYSGPIIAGYWPRSMLAILAGHVIEKMLAKPSLFELLTSALNFERSCLVKARPKGVSRYLGLCAFDHQPIPGTSAGPCALLHNNDEMTRNTIRSCCRWSAARVPSRLSDSEGNQQVQQKLWQCLTP